MPEALLEILAAVFGLLIGSFLNVCIYRWPRDLSVVRPRSKCPECERTIAWYDNVPVLSFLLLRRRCRGCGAAIPWRYLEVEILTALAFAFFAYRYGFSAAAAKYCVFSAILIGLAFADLETRILPDELTLGGTLMGFAFAWFVPVPDTTFHLIASIFGFQPGARTASLGEAVAGAVLCAGLLWLAGWIFEKVRHKEGLGFGDVKMLAMVGAFLGLEGAFTTIILGSALGAVIGLAWIRLADEDAGSFQLPFATFLAVAAMIMAMEGYRLIAWYGETWSGRGF